MCESNENTRADMLIEEFNYWLKSVILQKEQMCYGYWLEILKIYEFRWLIKTENLKNATKIKFTVE